MALDSLVAGAYTATWNAVAVGLTRQGFELSMQTKAEMIDETDQFGMTTIDWIYRGLDAFLQFTCRAYKAGSTGPFWPWAALGQVRTALLPIGRLASDVAQAVVLTATSATPAASSPASLTGSKSLLAPNFDGRLLFDSRLREVPIRLQLLPSDSTGTTTVFTTT